MSNFPKMTTLRLEVRERTAFLTLARPEAANTMNLAFGREFLAAGRGRSARLALWRPAGLQCCKFAHTRGPIWAFFPRA
jgi:hypothetical protein